MAVFYLSKMNVTEDIIQKACNEKQMNALAFFYLLKQGCHGSVIKDYSPQKLSKQTSISVNSIKKYIKWLSVQQVGSWQRAEYRLQPMIAFIDGKLFLSRVQPKYHICQIKLNNNTLHEIKKLLYGKLIHSFITAQKYAIKKKEEIKRIKQDPKKSEKRKYREYIKLPDSDPNPEISLSVRYICRRLSIGNKKLKEICGYLQEQRLLKVVEGKKELLRENGKILSGKNIFDCIYDLKQQFPFKHIVICSSAILICSTNGYFFS